MQSPTGPSQKLRPDWRWGVALLCLGTIGLLGGPVPRDPSSGPASGSSSSAGTRREPSDEATVRITLHTPEAFDGAATIEVRLGDEIQSREQSPLPHTIVLPRGEEALLVVEVPGRARFARRVRFEEDAELRVPLAPGASLAGVVVDDRGEAVAGAVILLEREDVPLPPWTTETDDEGRFVFDTLDRGPLGLRVASRGHGAVARTGVQPDGDSLRITLERVGSIAGRVIDENGSPRADATVVVAGSGLWPARQVRSDRAGRFRIPDVPPGIYEARAHAGSLVAEPRRGLEVGPDSRLFLTFSLRPGAVLTGIIEDSETHEPIEGAEITVAAEALDIAPRAATSDATGRFRVAGLRSVMHRVSVYAEGYVPVTALEHSPGQTLTVTLTAGGTLIGVVLDADHRPVEGATLEVLGEALDHQPLAISGQRGFRGAVFASQLEPMGMALEVTQGPVPAIPLEPHSGPELGLSVGLPAAAGERRLAASHVTDAEGRFTIAGIPPGRVQVVARRPGLASATTARLYVAAGTTRDDLELVLAPAGRLVGLVVDEREVGVEGVLVEVRSDREPHPRVAFTDLEGRFSLASVVGELSVTARPNGRPAVRGRTSVAPGGESELTLALEGELAPLFGRTVDERGFPVGGVQVAITSLRAEAPHRATLFSAEDGTFVARGLPAGPWRVVATSSRYAPSTVDVFDAAEEAQITLARGAQVRGTVLDDFSGEAIRASVTLIRDDLPPERLVTRTRGGGRWSIPRARAAAWTVVVEAEGFLGYEAPLVISEGPRGPEDVELEAIRLEPGGRIEGAVVDALGHVVPRARVAAGGRHTRADGRGRFALDGLAGGHRSVVASHPAAGESDPVDVRVLTGRETPGVVLHLPERFDPSRASALEGRRRGVAIELTRIDSETRVERVISGSHAERAGIRAGDRLLSIDGVTPADLAEARRLLRGSPSVGAILSVGRGVREATLHVRREVWLPD